MVTPLAIALTLCFILIGSAPREGIAISTIPWPDEEETGYTVQDQSGNTIGNGNLTIAKKGETYILEG